MTELKDLRKNISRYINRHPIPASKLKNDEWFKELNTYNKDSKEYKILRDHIILSNGAFATRYVMKYSIVLNEDTSISDLFQEAMIGIMESVDTFDQRKKVSFTTYAYFHVRKRIIDFIKHNKLIRAPRDIARNLKNVNDIVDIIKVKKGVNPSIKEIKKELLKQKNILLKDKTIENILILIDLNSATTDITFISEFTDQIGTDEESEFIKNMRFNILNLLDDYNIIEKNILKYRFGIGTEFTHTTNEIKLLLNKTDKELFNIKEI